MAAAPEVDLATDIQRSGSTNASSLGTIDFDDLSFETVFSKWLVY